MTEVVQEQPLIEIAASTGWRALDLREIYHYRELLHVLIWRDVKVRYRQTLLGVMWVVAQPLLQMIIFTLLFNRVAKIQAEANLPYSLYIMAALVPWTFFSTGVNQASNSLIGSAHLISKVYFPRMIVPAASVLSGVVDMVVTLGLVIVMFFWYSIGISVTFAFLPIAIAITALFAFGCGLWLSALNVEYRDIRVVIPFLLQIWMYATPVAYPTSAIPQKYRWIVEVNPMSGVIDAFRSSLLGRPLRWSSLAYSMIVAVVLAVSGAFYFRRVERQFADVL